MVQKTAGFEDFDENAIRALVTWRFEPLQAGRRASSGNDHVHYRLSDAN